MRFWVSHNTSTPISEQLKAQFILGILSKRLAPGGRLPSVRQLARQLRIHPNTVSGVYRELAQKGWVDARKGSGVFVRAHDGDGVGSSIEAFVRFCITQAEALGYSVEDVRAALDRVALDRANETRQSYSFVLTDPDEEFARVLAAEISDATGLSLESVPLNTLMDHLTP
jgi:DNA-binding transcriptional regulator YhcF (GntR family)